MSGIRVVINAIFRRRRFEGDMADEIAFHVERRAQDLITSGLSPDEALRRARVEFGGVEGYKDDCRQARGVRWLDELRADTRYSLRSLRRTPGFTLVALLSLAIGIGANTAIFSVIDAVWLRPMPVPHSSEIVRVFATTPQNANGHFSFPEYLDIENQAKSFRGLVAIGGRGSLLPQPDGTTQLLLTNVVSSNFFQVLGVKAAMGRCFGPADESASESVLVLGHECWRRTFGGDPDIVGRQIHLNRPDRRGLYTVIGVLPANFRSIDAAADRDLWMPPRSWIQQAGDDFSSRQNQWFHLMGRLAPGASVQSAQVELSAIAQRFAADYPATRQGRGIAVISDFSYRMRAAGAFGAVLFGIVILVLLLSAVNVANLLLARGAARVRELSTRVAVGAGRARIVRQLMTENAILGALGLAAGLGLGALLIQAMPLLIVDPPGYHIPLRFALDSRVFEASLIVAMATTVLFGLVPAMRISGQSPLAAMRAGIFRASGPRRFQLHQILVAGQVAVSLALLATAGVLVKSFVNTRTGDIGMTREPRLVVWLESPASLRPQANHLIRGLPGVTEVAEAIRAPLSLSANGIAQEVAFPERPQRAGEPPLSVLYNAVSSNYFSLMGVQIVRGRAFTAADQSAGAPVVIINEAMARRYWPGQQAVGRLIRVGGTKGALHRIVGVARNAPVNEIGEIPDPYLYLPIERSSFAEGEYTLIAATRQDAAALEKTARKTLLRFDKRLEPMGVTTEGELIRYSSLIYQITAALVSTLGLIGLLLTAVGLYGMVSWRVTERRREIGIRMAIGADRGATIRLILGDTARLGLAGFAIGLALALEATHLASAALFGVGPWDPPAFIAVGILLAAVLLLAALIPAHRATKIDPVTTLRCE